MALATASHHTRAAAADGIGRGGGGGRWVLLLHSGQVGNHGAISTKDGLVQGCGTQLQQGKARGGGS